MEKKKALRETILGLMGTGDLTSSLLSLIRFFPFKLLRELSDSVTSFPLMKIKYCYYKKREIDVILASGKPFFHRNSTFKNAFFFQPEAPSGCPVK